MIKQTTTVIALISAASLMTAAYGCSSSTSGGTSNDAGTGQDTGVSTGPVDSGSSTSKDSGSSSTKDSGSSTTSDSGVGSDDGGSADAGPTCPGDVADGSVPSPTAAVTATPTPGLCTDEQIQGFITACDTSTATQATCQAWGTANTACGNCIQPNNGHALTTGGPQIAGPSGEPYYNISGCIVQSTGGTASSTQTACATDFSNSILCQDLACGTCDDAASGGTDFTGCINATTPAPDCVSYNTALNADCPAADFADGGLVDQCADPTYILTLFCGGGDAGAGGDAGDGG